MTNFEELLPKQILFSIKDIEELGIIKSDMLRKLIYSKEIEVVKIGKKNFISRNAIVQFLQNNIIEAKSA